jgi:hypothetical protein
MSATKLFIVKQSTPVRKLEIEIRRPIFSRPRINSLFFPPAETPAEEVAISELKQATFLTTRTAWVTLKDWVKNVDWLITSNLLPVNVRVVKMSLA